MDTPKCALALAPGDLSSYRFLLRLVPADNLKFVKYLNLWIFFEQHEHSPNLRNCFESREVFFLTNEPIFVKHFLIDKPVSKFINILFILQKFFKNKFVNFYFTNWWTFFEFANFYFTNSQTFFVFKNVFKNIYFSKKGKQKRLNLWPFKIVKVYKNLELFSNPECF